MSITFPLLAFLLLPTPLRAARATPAAIQSFAHGCAPYEEEDYLTGKLELGGVGERWWRSRTAYEEEGCLTPWIQYEEEARVVRAEGELLDLRMVGVGYRPLTGEVAEALNLGAFCGRRDWRAGVLSDVSGRDCGDYPVPAPSATVYIRIRAAGDELRLSEPSPGADGSSEARRQRELGAAVYRPALKI